MNDKIKKECDFVINELLKFSDSLLELGEPIVDNRLEVFEINIEQNLSNDFKYILRKFNGFSLNGTIVNGLGSIFGDSSLDEVYNFEHFNALNKMPHCLFPFSNDGRGNYYCLDLSKYNGCGVCPIVFWQWDYHYKDMSEIEICNINFCDWIREVMIEWTLEDYMYNGEER